MSIKSVLLLGVLGMTILPMTQRAEAESKVFLVNGETRVGFVQVRFGRVTIKAVDRLYQHPEEAIHRIEHVTGETTLIGREGILLREKPEKLSKTLIAIPKGCEVHVLEVAGEWVKIRVFAGRDEAIGYLHTDDLSDEVLFNLVNPTVRFEPPPTNLRDLVDRDEIRRNLEQIEQRRRQLSETSFSAPPVEGQANLDPLNLAAPPEDSTPTTP